MEICPSVHRKLIHLDYDNLTKIHFLPITNFSKVIYSKAVGVSDSKGIPLSQPSALFTPASPDSLPR